MVQLGWMAGRQDHHRDPVFPITGSTPPKDLARRGEPAGRRSAVARRSYDAHAMHERSERDRTGAASGLLFGVLFVGGAIPLGTLLGSFGDEDAAFDTYFASSSNRAGNIVGGILLGASAFVFLWFLHHLRQWLQPDDNRAPTLANIMFSAGLVFVALLLVGTAALVTVPITLAFGDLYDTDDVLEVGQAVLPQLGYVVLALYGFSAAAVMVAVATVSARRSGSFPRWLCRLGFVVTGFLVLLGLSGGMAFFALPLWVLAVSVNWLRTPKGTSDSSPIAPTRDTGQSRRSM